MSIFELGLLGKKKVNEIIQLALVESIMQVNVDVKESNNEITKLEEYLHDFQEEWKEIQTKRSATWRKHFLISFIVTLAASLLAPMLWWTCIVVITYFAVSLFTLLRKNAKTSSQIIEHKKQLKLVRLLRNFESSPFSQK